MVSYSIHVIVEYNQAGSEIICRQIFVLWYWKCAEIRETQEIQETQEHVQI